MNETLPLRFTRSLQGFRSTEVDLGIGAAGHPKQMFTKFKG
jgi:hypothetical protein